jgi:prepilin-type N-terminal cleavage/methylation domain-containing protein
MTMKAIESVKKNVQAGFSLVELMVVVTIIGILAGIAVPKFQTFRARAQQTEAKSGLNGVYLAMQAYQANYNDFPATNGDVVNAAGTGAGTANIGFAVAGGKPKYRYEAIARADAAGAAGTWAAKAISINPLIDGRTDTMRINVNKWSCSMFDAVTNTAATELDARNGTLAVHCPQSNNSANGTALALRVTNTATSADIP